jgi:hypothetical protein
MSHEAAQVLVNAVRYPLVREALLYRRDTYTDNSLEALNRLHLRYQLASDAAGMTAAFAYPASHWNPIVYDSPNYQVGTDGAGLVDYIADGGKATISTWYLTAEPLCDGLRRDLGRALMSNCCLPVDPTSPAHHPMAVPDLLPERRLASNGDCLSVAAADGVALAGVIPLSPPTRRRSCANGGRTTSTGSRG